MKLSINNQEFDQLPVLNRLFLALWKQKKGYGVEKTFCKCQLEEIAFALTPDLKFDTPALRTTFNNLLEYDEYMMAWEGSEPIDILWHELNRKLNKRILSYMSANIK